MRRMLSWRYRYAPWKLANLNRLDNLLRGDIDHRDVVGDTVGDQQILLVRRERHVPDPLPDQKIFRHGMACDVDHRDAIGRTERDKGGFVVLGDADPDRLDGLTPQARNVEDDLAGDGVFDRIDDRDCAADLGGDPQFRTVVLEFGEARPRVDQYVGDDLAGRGIDEMRHVGGLGGIDQDLAVWTDRHSFGFDAD